MSSRWPDVVRLLLSTLLEALWLGALAALLVAAPPAPTIVLCWAIVAGAALLAAAARGAVAAVGAAPAPVRYRLLLLGLGFPAAAALFLVAAPHGPGQIVAVTVRSLVFVGVSLELGVLAGRAEIDAERAFRRAVRSFALVFAVVFVSYAAHEPLAGSGFLVALVVLAGLALVAVARVLVTLQAIEGRRFVWRWTAGVVVAGLLALALAALIVAVPAGGALAWFGGLVIVGLHGLLDAVGYVIAALGYLVLRAVVALASAVHLHPHLPELRPPSTWHVRIVKQPQAQPHSGVPAVLGVVVLVALALLALRLLLRSFRIERDSVEDTALEEREPLARPAAEMRAAGRRLVDRLAQLIGVSRARTPTEALRAEYRRLERSLLRGGHAREPSWSARRYLTALSVTAGDGGPDPGAAVARLATLYERARYAETGVGWPEVGEFREGLRTLLAAMSKG